jgi:hypothetical protein
MQTALLAPSPFEADGGRLIGRDPRELTRDEWENSGLDLKIGLKAIRAKCLDCCGGSSAEVRKCTATACALWPMRIGTMPKGLRALRRAEAEADDQEGAE